MPGRDPELFALPEEIAPRTKNYVGSVAVTADGGTAVFSAPKGSFVFAFAAGSGDFVGSVDVADGCGLAPVPGGEAAVLVTAGTGAVERWRPTEDLAASDVGLAKVAFDNHLVRLG